MLTHLHISDFAIVDRLDLDFEAGMTVLTGETGAGKSILIDALGLALGDRADTSIIREGCVRAEVAAAFDLGDAPAARAWLAEQELDEEEECVLRRTLSAEGRSRGYINGRPAPMQSLRELGELLIDIHGQHEHQSLLRPEVQTALLDGYGDLQAPARSVAATAREWRAAREELERLSTAAAERDARRELLAYQLQELEALDLQPGEVETLEEEHRRLANGGRLLEEGGRTLALLHEDDETSAAALLGTARRGLEELQALDPELAPVTELAENAEVQLKEAALELRRYLDRLELDPERLQWVEARIEAVHDLSRKHRVYPTGLTDLTGELAEDLAGLEGADQRRTELAARVETLAARYREEAGALSAGRARVASGGELSRISLAIQVATVQAGTVPTLIFDEVDVGIGGGVAEVVGQSLRSLGGTRQVLTVTHLPQVAAQGHHHLQVGKQKVDGANRTRVRPLSPDQRVDEIGRMLGGLEITDNTLAHAREMLELATVGS
jgi:DNA repair protein RecN (Recombination protein N)